MGTLHQLVAWARRNGAHVSPSLAVSPENERVFVAAEDVRAGGGQTPLGNPTPSRQSHPSGPTVADRPCAAAPAESVLKLPQRLLVHAGCALEDEEYGPAFRHGSSGPWCWDWLLVRGHQ